MKIQIMTPLRRSQRSPYNWTRAVRCLNALFAQKGQKHGKFGRHFLRQLTFDPKLLTNRRLHLLAKGYRPFRQIAGIGMPHGKFPNMNTSIMLLIGRASLRFWSQDRRQGEVPPHPAETQLTADAAYQVNRALIAAELCSTEDEERAA
jgi:hypothetical protein